MNPGATSQPGEQTGAAEVNATETTTGGAVGVQTGQTGLTSQTGQTVTGQGGVESTYNATIGVQVGIPGQPEGLHRHPGITHGAFVYNSTTPYYIPPKTYNPHIVARDPDFLDQRGLARVSKYHKTIFYSPLCPSATMKITSC